MNKIDLHVHTIASGHAFNTLYELAAAAAERGMEALCITDHGPAARNTTNLPYFWVLCNRVPARIGSIRIFKGIEANILDHKGATDIPEDPKIRENFDLVLAALHTITSYRDLGKVKNTCAIIKALEVNPAIDILAHPVTNWFEIDEQQLARAAAAAGVAIELNESNLKFGGADPERIHSLIENTLSAEGCFVISSDAHIATELGQDEYARQLVTRFGIPESRIINSSLQHTRDFIRQRKTRKSGLSG